MYDENVEYPFSCVNLAELADTEFPMDLIEGSLDDDARILPFELFPNQRYCCFGKVEQGRK